MHDLNVLATVILVLLTKCMETVRTGSNNFLDAKFIERLQVCFSEHLEQILVTSSTSSITAASFLHSKYADIETCFFHDGDCVSGDLLVSFIERSGATCEIDVLGGFGDLHI